MFELYLEVFNTRVCFFVCVALVGDGGGEIVAQGTPEDIVMAKRSYTGELLKPMLGRQEKPKKRIEAAE